MSHQHWIQGAGLIAALGLSACTAGQTGPPTQKTVNPTGPGQSVLRMSVGTANIAGYTGLGLNVVATLRNPQGQSAVNLNTPKLTGPFTLPNAQVPAAPTYPYSSTQTPYDQNSTANLAPSSTEISGAYIGGSPQAQQAGAPAAVNTTFGTSGGVFGNGFGPGNYGTAGLPASFYPYYQPFYGGSPLAPSGTTNPSSNTFFPEGGPPAFDPAGNGRGATGGNFPDGGPALGINTFALVKPAAGTYTLAVAVPTTGSTLAIPAATASLSNAGLVLPFATAGGAAPSITFDGSGGVSVTNVALSGGVTGAYVQLTDYGPTDTTTNKPAAGCNGAGVTSPVVYTAWVTTTGTVSFTNANAPVGQTSAVCSAVLNTTFVGTGDTITGDQVQAVVIGFDYNQYSLQYNGKTGATYPQAPTLPAQADISISPATWVLSP